MIDSALLEQLRHLGPEQLVAGFELCPCCHGLSPGIAVDGETVMHCPVCHDQNAITVADTDRWRDEMRKCYGSRSDEID
jgi:hypothetical protein